MFCNQCGTQLPNDSRFCSKCGAKLAAATPAPVQRPAPVQESCDSWGVVPPPVKTMLGLPTSVTCDVFKNANNKESFTGVVSLPNNKTLTISTATYLVVAVQTKQINFDLNRLQRVTVTAEGTGLLGRKHEAVFYPKDAIPFKLVGSGKEFLNLVQNAAFYANAPMARI